MITMTPGFYGRVTTAQLLIQFAFQRILPDMRDKLNVDAVKALGTLRDVKQYAYINIMIEPDSDKGLTIKWDDESVKRIEHVESLFKNVVCAIVDNGRVAKGEDYKDVLVTLAEFKKYLKAKIKQSAKA